MFDDANETGGAVCNSCGEASDGFNLLCWLNDWPDREMARTAVAEYLQLQPGTTGKNGTTPKRASQPRRPRRQKKSAAALADTKDVDNKRAALNRRWSECIPDNGRIAAYLQHRGLSVKLPVPPTLRLHQSLGYYEEAKTPDNPDAPPTHVGDFPAIVAKIIHERHGLAALHRTYLDGSPYQPGKAAVPSPKKLSTPIFPGSASGAAIHLYPFSQTTGTTLAITEGIETALAIRQACPDLPVWSTVSAGGMGSFEAPAGCRRLEIYADAGDVGHTKALECAAANASLRSGPAAIEVVIVSPPAHLTGCSDWLDVLVKLTREISQEAGEQAIRDARITAIPYSRPAGERPTVTIRTAEHLTIDEAVLALVADEAVYQRGGALVGVIRESAENRKIVRPANAPKIVPLPEPRLRERLTLVADWLKQLPARDDPGEFQTIPAHPPVWAIRAVMHRGEWPVRHLEAIVETPVITPDGSILNDAGYHDDTGLLYQPSQEFDPVPHAPTQTDAAAACQAILDVVGDFPFSTTAHASAWLASVLTPLARFGFTGPAPLFLVDANVRGAGKSLLCDIAGIICTGREMARTVNTALDDEMRKRITAIALAGDRTVMIDNVSGPLGCPSLDAALTSTVWVDRVLGKSENTNALPLLTVWYATGNNVEVRGDLARRTLHIRLESPEENPEERQDFAHANIRQYAHDNRHRLVPAALTILRAYCTAGRPAIPGVAPWGSFEGWSNLVRQALIWAGQPDPGETRAGLAEAADSDTNALRKLLAGWADLPTPPNNQIGFTAAQLIEILHEDEFLPAAQQYLGAMREAIEELQSSKSRGLPGIHALGRMFRRYSGRKLNGKCLLQTTNTKKTAIWYVKDSAGVAGVAGVVSLNQSFSREGGKGDEKRVGGGMTPATPATPATEIVEDWV
ncbi:MAG: hypothetical protein A3E01_02895 [Gammaproteobacteria bacterium RIFCSPHIGHO2_12_FULL_63_22]|nr:MAG: hypothetical protein A3E01_02895 [Gammaproteobacteria bacterium RIFCSPHIGHO2_12_FULL_63_22]